MRNTEKALIWLSIAFGMFAGCIDTGMSHDQPTRSDTQPPTRPMGIRGLDKSEIRFGRAHIVLGMNKEEVLEQIRLSRAQYGSPLRANSSDIFVRQPSEDTIDSDTWMLICPSLNSHLLGGGSGIMLTLRFLKGEVVEIKQLPWLFARRMRTTSPHIKTTYA